MRVSESSWVDHTLLHSDGMQSMISASAQGRLFVGDGGNILIGCGGCSIKGRRPQQEDVLMVISQQYQRQEHSVHTKRAAVILMLK